MKADYHIHTLCSDGIYTVEEVFQKILANRIQSFAITDHDTIAGIPTARALSRNRISFISGLEFTCSERFLPSAGLSFSIHLLGYGFDEENRDLRQRLDLRSHAVTETYQTLCRELCRMGCPVALADVPISCGNVLQLCDVQNHLETTFGTLSEEVLALLYSYNARLSAVNISLEEGIHLIHQAGGTAVWAHPFHIYQSFKKVRISKEQVTAILDYLVSQGLNGVEALYADFSEEDRNWLKELADRRQLFYTAGSDFHGSPGRDTMGLKVELQFPNI